MSIENSPKSKSPVEQIVVVPEERKEVFPDDIDRLIEIEDLKKEIVKKKEFREKIAIAEIPRPKKVEEGKTPGDIDLWSLDQEEALKRREAIRERYADVLEQIRPVGKKLEGREATDFKTREKIISVEEDQEISYANLVFVRACDSLPNWDERSDLKILNSEEESQRKYPRETIHFTLNHRVNSHGWGSWENRPYQLIVPGDAMVEKNGDPTNLYAIDTFYAKSITLPEGTVIIYEKGKKPEIPTTLKDKVILMERDLEINDRELVSLVIEKMGYIEHAVVISGGIWEDIGNLDKLVDKFAQSKELGSCLHSASWCWRLEEIKSYLQDKDFRSAMYDALSMYHEDFQEAGELKRVPKESKKKMWRGIFEFYKLKEREWQIEWTLEKWIEKVLRLDSERIWRVKISDEDRALIIQEIPREGWQCIIDSFKQRVREGFISSDIEAKSMFQNSFKKPFEEITHQELEINYE